MTGRSLSRRQVLAMMAAAGAGTMVGGSAVSALGGSSPARVARQVGRRPASAGGELSLSHWWGEQWAHWLPLMEEKTGIAVREERTPYGEYPQKVLTQIASGTAADLIVLEPAMNGDFLPSGQLLPVGDYLASSGVDMSKWNIDPMRELGFDGQLMGFPLQTSQDRIVHVNRGLAEPDGLLDEAPLWGTDIYDTWDWDTFVEWAKAGTKITSDGTVEQYGLGRHQPAVEGVDRRPRRHVVRRRLELRRDGLTVGLRTGRRGGHPDHRPDPRAQGLPTPRCRSIGARRQLRRRTGNVHVPMVDRRASTPKRTPSPRPTSRCPSSSTRPTGSGRTTSPSTSRPTTPTWPWSGPPRSPPTRKCASCSSRSAPPPGVRPAAHRRGAAEGTGKTIALIQLSRIKGMSTIPENAEGVVQYPGWWGRYASAFTQRPSTRRWNRCSSATPPPKKHSAKPRPPSTRRSPNNENEPGTDRLLVAFTRRRPDGTRPFAGSAGGINATGGVVSSSPTCASRRG